MAKKPITSFEPISLTRLQPLIECLGPLNLGNPSPPDWWLGILSSRTVVYGSGRIAREGDRVRHKVDPEELARCRALAAAARLLGPPGLPSEGEFQWYPFFVATNLDDPIPGRIDKTLIRERFGGTILPVAPITARPLRDKGAWWTMMVQKIRLGADNLAKIVMKVDLDVWMERSLRGARALEERQLDRYETDKRQQAVGDPLLREILEIRNDDSLTWTTASTALELFRLLRLVRFFGGPDFSDAAYVEIGTSKRVSEKRWPPGMESWPSCLPRLLVGVTRAGSLAGLIGHVVET